MMIKKILLCCWGGLSLDWEIRVACKEAAGKSFGKCLNIHYNPINQFEISKKWIFKI
jgi:hypothetical protein